MLRLPIFRALIAQVVMLLVLFALAQLGLRLPAWLFMLVQGIGAAGLGYCFGLSRWWWVLNAFFVPGLLLVQRLGIASYWPLLGFLLLLALFWNSLRERVPLYLSDALVRQHMKQWLAERPNNFRFVDLGCGIGSMLCPMARAFPNSQFVGVETAPLSFLIAWLRSLPLPNCQVRYLSLWRLPLQSFDVVYCFLSPQPMPALWAKACAEMQAQSYLVSNSFAVPDVPAHQQWLLGGWRSAQVYLWQMQSPLAAVAAEG